MNEHETDKLHQEMNKIREDVERLQSALGHIFQAIDELSKLAFDVPQLVARSTVDGEVRQELLSVVKDEASRLQSALKEAHPLIWGKSK